MNLLTRVSLPFGMVAWCLVGGLIASGGAGGPRQAARPGDDRPGGEPRAAWLQPPDTQPEDDDDDDARAALRGPYVVDERRLTNQEISRIRYMELRGMRLRTTQPDRVTVKVSRETIDEFLATMEGHPDFDTDRKRREFLKMTPPQKLHVMATYGKEAFADKVEIQTDPEVFVEFKRNVLPAVLRGCATSGCHASAAPVDQVKFRLFKDPKKTAAATYGSFLILAELEHQGRPVINRAQVTNSLLLTYMLPTSDVRPELRHPGDLKIKPLFNSRSAQGFRRIEDWIRSLRNPPGDYGVRLLKSPDEAEGVPQTDGTTRP